MARVLGLWNSALRAARGGMNASQWYEQLRRQGIAPRSSEAYALFKIAVQVHSTAGQELTRDQTVVPRPGPNDSWPSRKARGIRQGVTLTYRNRTTGTNVVSYWSVISEKGITRQEAVQRAIAAYADHAEAYDQDLIMAVHSSAKRLVPWEF